MDIIKDYFIKFNEWITLNRETKFMLFCVIGAILLYFMFSLKVLIAVSAIIMLQRVIYHKMD